MLVVQLAYRNTEYFVDPEGSPVSTTVVVLLLMYDTDICQFTFCK